MSEQALTDEEREGLASLWDSERDVLAGLAAGLTTTQIAAQRVTSPHTIKGQIAAIHRKLGVQSRIQAVGVYYRDLLAAPTHDRAVEREEETDHG